MKLHIESISQLEQAAKDLISYAADEKVFLFFGEMGAGKTTFIKTICRQLGVTDAVASPTYSIVNEYDGPDVKIYHFDFYRLKDQLEALDMGFEEYLHSGAYCLIEWPEKIDRFWPQNYIRVDISLNPEDERIISASRVK